MKLSIKTSAALILTTLILIIPLTANPVLAVGEGVGSRLTASSGKPSVGQTITLTISLSAALDITNYDMVLSYDPALFSFVGDSEKNLATGLSNFDIQQLTASSIKIVAFGGSHAGISKLCQMKFKALKTGTAQFSVSDMCINDDIYPASSSKSVTIIEAVVLSGDNALKSLEIDQGILTPAFSKDQKEYTVSLQPGVSELAISAVPADSKAKVSVSGSTGLVDGDNEILVVVTAENGSKLTYTIVANRAMPTPTPEISPTPPVMLTLPGGNFTVADPPAEIIIPEGFFETMTSLNGQMVPSFKAMKGDLTLIYLASESGGSGFYYFSSQSQSYIPFTLLEMPAKGYSVLKPEADTSVPQGFSETALDLNGQSLPAWKPDVADSVFIGHDMYLLYLMDSQGDKNFYWIDKTTKMLYLYLANQTAPTETTITPVPSASPAPDPASAGTAPPFNPWQLATVLLGLLSLILTGAVIWLSVRYRKEADHYRGSFRVSAEEPEETEPEPVIPDDRRRAMKPRPPRIRRVD